MHDQYAIPNRTDPSQRPSSRRLRRITDRWIPIEQAALMARITVLDHGGRERPVIQRGSQHSRFILPSSKTGLSQVGEGRGEELFALYHEVRPRTSDYQMHPFKIEARSSASVFSYRPDAIVQDRDGLIDLVEVKRTPEDLRDPELRHRLAIIREIVRRCGWRFRVIYLDEIIGPKHRLANVDALFGRRAIRLTDREKAEMRSLTPDTPVSWGDLRDRLAPTDPLRGDAAIEGLIAQGRLDADIDARFTPDTQVTPLAPVTERSAIRL